MRERVSVRKRGSDREGRRQKGRERDVESVRKRKREGGRESAKKTD